jgi:acetate kinase
MVHGGEHFKSSVLVDDAVLRAIEECFDIAPLHNPPNVKGYRAARDLMRDAPHVAVFDTAFHQTMEPVAFLYALPYVLYERHAIRRYGFHGTSHRFVSRRAAELLGRADDPLLRLVTCHLGNGCSVAAIRGGRSVDTSMGFTPLEGLVMGTRSGDLDPAILLHVMAKEELGPGELNALLNKHSGLLGLSGLSNDMRKLLEAEAAGNERAKLAVDVFCYRLRKYIAAYVGALGGLDALVFTGGIGENAAAVRERSVAGLGAMGVAIDPAANAQARGREADVAPPGPGCRVLVVPTNEELLIARDTYRIVRGLPLA